MRIFLMGATGATGSELVLRCLQNPNVTELIVLARKPAPLSNPKLTWIVKKDLLQCNESDWDILKGVDGVLCALGTTQAQTPDPTMYYAIDVDLPVTLSYFAKIHKVPVFAVISAVGANPKSLFSYSRYKGKMELQISAHKHPLTLIFRPSLIHAKRDPKRLGESIAYSILRGLDPIVPHAYKYVSAHKLASFILDKVLNTKPVEEQVLLHVFNSSEISKYKVVDEGA